MPLFEIAVLVKPSHDEANRGEQEKLVFGPKAIVAKDAQSAPLVAALDPGFPKGMDPGKLEVLCRPFSD